MRQAISEYLKIFLIKSYSQRKKPATEKFISATSSLYKYILKIYLRISASFSSTKRKTNSLAVGSSTKL